MAAELKLYPSGFLGSSTVAQTEPMDVISTAKQLFNKGINPKVSKYTANGDVVALWDAVCSGIPEYKTFEFKERILRTALGAFGTEKIVDWIGTQTLSPYFSDYHRRWIDETLWFIYAGKRRQMSNNNWKVLLTTNGENDKGPRFSRTVNHFLLGEKLRTETYEELFRGNLTVAEFVGNWCAADDGLDDLIGSLNVLFGKR